MVGGVFGLAEAGTFKNIASYIIDTASKGSGQISFPSIMILLATGIVGVLGIRRREKKS